MNVLAEEIVVDDLESLQNALNNASNGSTVVLGKDIDLSGNSEKTVVAKIGDVEYETLQAAIDAVEDGDIIVLTGDVTEKVELTGK